MTNRRTLRRAIAGILKETSGSTTSPSSNGTVSKQSESSNTSDHSLQMQPRRGE